MNSTSSCRFGWLLGNALLLPVLLAEDVPAVSPESTSEVAAPIPGVFGTELPRLVLPESLRLTLRPHFRDFISKDYFRLTFGAIYGLNAHWELKSELDTYIAHGLGDAPVAEKFGISRIRLGAKYRFSDFLRPYWDTVAGLTYSFPVGSPPPNLTDEIHHLTPYMTLAHKWASRPNVTSFVSYGVDFATSGDAKDPPNGYKTDASKWFITPGLVWKQGAFDYSLETTLSSTLGLDSREEYKVTVRPGVKWTLPQRLTFKSRSRWIVGVGVHGSYGSYGGDFGTSFRVQTDFDFKHFLKKISGFDSSPPVKSTQAPLALTNP